MQQSLGSQITEALIGAGRDKVMLLYIGGGVSFVVGIYLVMKG